MPEPLNPQHSKVSFKAGCLLTRLRLLAIFTILLAGCTAASAPPALQTASPPARETAAPVVLDTSPAQPVFPTESWRTSTPEQQGMDSELLAQMFEVIEEQELNLDSLLIIRNNELVAEAYFYPFRQDTKHELYSCTKSFISALVGIAVDRGYITRLDQPILDYFSGQVFANPDGKAAITLEHLLTMTSGLGWEEGDPVFRELYFSRDWVQYVLDLPLVEEPGGRFNYCSGCSHVLSAILQGTTEMSTLDFARQHLFEPLGIRDVEWEVDAQGIPIGGWGLNLTSRDMAKLGILYLHQGRWEGEQILSSGWVESSLEKQVDAGNGFFYGYQWWVYPSLGAYTALGRDGQMIFVIPETNLVIVTTAETGGHDAIFGLIERFIAPAVRSAEPLPANPTGQSRLQTLTETAGKH